MILQITRVVSLVGYFILNMSSPAFEKILSMFISYTTKNGDDRCYMCENDLVLVFA